MASDMQPTVASETSSDVEEAASASPSIPPPPRADHGSARPRAQSSIPPTGQQPIKDAVSSAFNSPDIMSSQVSPDLVQHITEAVINKLRLQGVNPAATAGQAAGSPETLESISDSAASIVNARDIYTPPSPGHDVESMHGSSSDYVDIQSDGQSENNPGFLPVLEKPPKTKKDGQTRPVLTQKNSMDEGTTLEKIWQRLFDKQGHPTKRLGQFLRGLALHIIEDYEPCNSLVITPQKMLRFYNEVRINDEIYPWSAIFGGKMTNSSLSHLYRDLNCQHHFVQKQTDDKPSVPALTPGGFETWMTIVIRAHPEEEFHRFGKAVLDMPISNADDRKERFPKQLSRRLFPKQMNVPLQELFEDSVLADPDIELPRRHRSKSPGTHLPPTPGPPPPHAADPGQQMPKQPPPPPHYASPPSGPNGMDRDRQQYSTSSSEAAVEDGPPQPGPIERERKPYSAAPSAGRGSDNGPRSRSNTTANASRPRFDEDLGPPPGRKYRAGSQAAGRSGFMGQQQQQQQPPPNRQRSPSAASSGRPYARSESEMPPNNNLNPGGIIGRHDESDDELSRSYSRESRNGRRNSRYVPEYPPQRPPSRPRYEEDYARRGPPPPPQGNNGYGNQQYAPPPPPRY